MFKAKRNDDVSIMQAQRIGIESLIYSCPLCASSNFKLLDFISHVKTEHGQQHYPVSCPLCRFVIGPEAGEVTTMHLSQHLVDVHLSNGARRRDSNDWDGESLKISTNMTIPNKSRRRRPQDKSNSTTSPKSGRRRAIVHDDPSIFNFGAGTSTSGISRTAPPPSLSVSNKSSNINLLIPVADIVPPSPRISSLNIHTPANVERSDSILCNNSLEVVAQRVFLRQMLFQSLQPGNEIDCSGISLFDDDDE